jgi:hypothetical protein
VPLWARRGDTLTPSHLLHLPDGLEQLDLALREGGTELREKRAYLSDECDDALLDLDQLQQVGVALVERLNGLGDQCLSGCFHLPSFRFAEKNATAGKPRRIAAAPLDTRHFAPIGGA